MEGTSRTREGGGTSLLCDPGSDLTTTTRRQRENKGGHNKRDGRKKNKNIPGSRSQVDVMFDPARGGRGGAGYRVQYVLLTA